MRVFVIVVTYNGIKWIDRCLGNLRRSEMAAEVIVIDNGSTDGTQNKIRNEFPEINFVEAAENMGFSKANNLGISIALREGADYIFLLNQDAWVEKDTLQRLVEVSGKYPEYGIISPVHLNGTYSALDIGFSIYVSPQKCPDFYSDVYLHTLKDIYEVEFVNAAAWLLTADCIKKVGLFEPLFFFYGEDGNYIHRVRGFEFKIGVTPHCTICHDRGERKGKLNKVATRLRERTYTLMIILNASQEFKRPLFAGVQFRMISALKAFFRMDIKAVEVNLLEIIYVITHMRELIKTKRAYSREGYLL